MCNPIREMHSFHICRQKQSASSTHEHGNLPDSLKGGGRLKELTADRDKNVCRPAHAQKAQDKFRPAPFDNFI